MAADGNSALVGGPQDDGEIGAAWIFARSGATWAERAKLVGGAAIGPGDQGWSVALSGDGGVAAVGGMSDNRRSGAVWTFDLSGATAPRVR